MKRDPFDNPMIGVEIKDPNGNLTCAAWSDKASSFVFDRNGLHYTNSHTTWLEMMGETYQKLLDLSKERGMP